jgi:hypothetical protein
MEAMSPRSPDWTERQWVEFLDALAYVRATLSATTCQERVGVSRQTMNNWASRTCAPSADNREAVVSLAALLRKSLG